MATGGIEPRNMREGSLVWVQASGSANPGWTTGASPASGVFAFVRSMQVTSARTMAVIMERGKPKFNKIADEQAIGITVNCGFTGHIPAPATAAGVTVPEIHLEYKMDQPEIGAGHTGQYMQFYRVPWSQLQFSEGAEEDTLQFTMAALGMLVTDSGYMANHIV